MRPFLRDHKNDEALLKAADFVYSTLDTHHGGRTMLPAAALRPPLRASRHPSTERPSRTPPRRRKTMAA